MKYIHSKRYDKSRLLEVLSLDDIVYDKKLTGTFESVSGRYKTNEEMFIFAVDDEDKMCGYICFFPITDELYERIMNEDVMFDDNIQPKDIKQYTKDSINNLFVISVARFPQSKGHGIGFNLVKEMFSYLNSLSELGYEIGNILAVTTSAEGDKLFSKFNFQKVRSYGNEGTLLKYEFISYKDMDLYLFTPVKLSEDFENKAKDANYFLDLLTTTCKLEVNSLINDRINRLYLGKLKFRPEDDYGNTVNTKILSSNIYLSFYKDIGTLIIEFPSISFDPTFVLDQSSRNNLKILSQNEEILLDDYLKSIGLTVLGNPNHLLVSGKKIQSYYRKFILFAEAYFNRIGSRIISKEAQIDAETNIAQYEFADIYASGVGITFEINSSESTKTYETRLEVSILMIYILEILALEIASLKLLQNTITYEFDNSPQPSIEIIESLIENYGKYLILFEHNYKYNLAKCLSDRIAEKFNIDSMKKDYQANVEQLNRIVTIRSERKSKEFSTKQDLLFKIVSVFTLLLSINNIISLFVDVDFSSKKSIIVFNVTIAVWLIAIIYLILVWARNKSSR